VLKINGQRLISDIMANLNVKLDSMAKYAEERMVGIIASLPDSGSHDSVGASDWRADVSDAIKYIAANESLMLVRKVGLIDADELTKQRGFLINYGMGVDYYKGNPFLDDYLASEYYDSKRGGFNVYTRPGDEVYDYETGLWYDSTMKSRYEIERFHQNPSLWFTDVWIEIEEEFKALVLNALSGINFAEYLENV
jgi:hypothetical protein